MVESVRATGGVAGHPTKIQREFALVVAVAAVVAAAEAAAVVEVVHRESETPRPSVGVQAAAGGRVRNPGVSPSYLEQNKNPQLQALFGEQP